MSRTQLKKSIALIICVLLWGAVGCGSKDPGATPTPDVGVDATGQTDTSGDEDARDNQGTSDTSPPAPDTSTGDAGVEDTGSDEDATADGGSEDAGSEDASSEDASGNDAGDAGDAGEGDVEQDTGPAELTGDTCETAVDVTAGGVWEDQTTIGYTDNYETAPSHSGCPSNRNSGLDRTYFVAPQVTTEYRVRVDPTTATYDPAIYIKSDCAQNACINGSILNGPGTFESVTFIIQGGQTAFIIVDGEGFQNAGDYTLTVEII